ncbi:MAG: transposase [Novosphingobium sp.]
MPRVIELADDSACSLAECAHALGARGFDPMDEESLAHAALWLRRLGNNGTFIADLLVDNLAHRHREDADRQSYGPQSIVLSDHRGNCFLRANIWPGKDDHLLQASGRSPFLYDMPHDHNFHFLTLGYFGPGYWSDYYEYDYAEVAGWQGEPVRLKPIGRERLEPGKLMLYRAHHDVHRQLPADALSVSVNVMHANPALGWLDQYRFDVEGEKLGAIISHGSTDAFLRVAVAMGGDEALDLAEGFAARHPSDRMRLTAADALASRLLDVAERDAFWAKAEASGSRMVAAEAKARRAAIA